jgi:uncharacterized protein YegJ (DUF2314 family)
MGGDAPVYGDCPATHSAHTVCLCEHIWHTDIRFHALGSMGLVTEPSMLRQDTAYGSSMACAVIA